MAIHRLGTVECQTLLQQLRHGLSMVVALALVIGRDYSLPKRVMVNLLLTASL